jgi:sulfur relay (sulfurtransferase) DsrF/TusC family protein
MPVIRFCLLPELSGSHGQDYRPRHPGRSHRPVEALRIALGLVAGNHATTVVLLNEAARLLSEDTDDVVDVEILEKYLQSIQQLEVPFVLPESVDRSGVRTDFAVRYESDETIRRLLQSMDRTLIF